MNGPVLVSSLLILLAGLLIPLVWLTWKSPGSARTLLRESFFRNTGVRYRNMLGVLAGFTGSVLLLSGAELNIAWVALAFVGALFVTMALFVVVRPYNEKRVDRFAWGFLMIVVLGFGLGALTYQYRHWIKWLWHQYLRINEPHELILEALFLLGVVLGVFVVRNWAKEQKDFLSSLSGVLGGAFVATILGKLQGEGINEIGALKAFAYYALGFTVSGAVNLALAARLTANYVNRKSIASRAMLDFLYGSERANLIDGYFLKNFKEDPDYAKRWLTDTLNEYRTLVRSEFADLMQKRKNEREKGRYKFVTAWIESKSEAALAEKTQRPLGKAFRAEKADKMLRAFEEKGTELVGRLNEAEAEKRKLVKELESLSAGDATRAKKEDERSELDVRIKRIEEEKKELERILSPLKPSYYYELIAIENDEKKPTEKPAPPPTEDAREYAIIYKRVPEGEPGAHTSTREKTIHEGMFRVGIAMRRQDKLEYIIAPGQYGVSFPVLGSVAGLALLMGHTIVMDRDRNKKFRSRDYGRGVCPSDIEQQRGLDEINYLSYFSIPIVARKSSSDENSLGISNVDTKLFVTQFPLEGEHVEGSEGVFRTHLQHRVLSEFGSNLYEEEDKAVQYVEDHTKIITPVLELYSKCRVGAP